MKTFTETIEHLKTCYRAIVQSEDEENKKYLKDSLIAKIKMVAFIYNKNACDLYTRIKKECQ